MSRSKRAQLVIAVAGSALIWTGAMAGGPTNKAFARLLCNGRSGCSIGSVTTVGSASGAPQAVVMVFTEDKDPSYAFDGCRQAEYWLVTGPAAKPTKRQLLANGYSGQCASVGDDATISQTEFQWTDMVGGGHPDHYSHTTSVSLAPLAFKSANGTDAVRFPSTNVTGYDWSWDAFRGSGSAAYFRCDASGDAATDHEPSGPVVQWATIPALPDKVSGVVHLGACAVNVDGATNGFTTFGKPGADASFRAVVAGHELLVEVTDDHYTGSGSDWTFDDHVEIWLTATASPQILDKCEDLRAPGAKQWGVRIADAAVFAAAGHPTDRLTVRRSPATAADGQPVLLAISLPAWFDPKASGLTVVYSDSDDGKTQKRLLATSQMQHGKRYTIGRTRVIDPREATCTVTAGSLEPVLNHRFKPDRAMIEPLD